MDDGSMILTSSRFLLPALQISSVLGQTTRRQILAALDALLMKLSDALDAALERIKT
jgi:hypothetical protein